ncbi:MAG TPA: hypothetical protein VF192_02960 [Longimicrobiales bacterium]
MDDLGSLLVLAFVVWSVLGSVLGRGRTQAPPRRGAPPRPRPRSEHAPPPGAPPEPRHETTQARGAALDQTGEEMAASTSAADMIPDELWEILTGEKRRPVVVRPPEAEGETRPAGTRAHVPDLEPDLGEDFEPEFGPEDVVGLDAEPAPVPVSEDRPLEVLRPAGRAESLEAEPVVVSLEAPLPSAAERHAAFHARIAGAAVEPARGRVRSRIPVRLGGRSELRRAMILHEVLGPPKALE